MTEHLLLVGTLSAAATAACKLLIAAERRGQRTQTRALWILYNVLFALFAYAFTH